MKFRRYQKLERYGRTGVYGINKGECYIFPKLDGTNGSVWLEDGKINAGSRNRKLSLEKDNAGFYNEIINDENLYNLLKDNPNIRLYGEFLVPHTIKYYEDNAWRKFYIFDVVIEHGNDEYSYLHYEDYRKLLDKYKLNYIKPIDVVIDGEYEDFIKYLNKNTFLTKENKPGEGIVIKNYSFINKFQDIRWAKIINDDAFKKEKKNKCNSKSQIDTNCVESQIIDKLLTESLIRKEHSKILLDKNTEWSSSYISELINNLWEAFIIEEIPDVILNSRNLIIDFKLLKTKMVLKMKDITNDLF